LGRALKLARIPIRKVVAVTKRALINEDRFQYIIEIAVPPKGLDAQTSRSIIDFHRSRNIQVRFGHGLKNLSRWCFSDGAVAEDFKEQFGGHHVVKKRKTSIKRTMPSILAAALLSNPIGYLISSGCEVVAQVGI
jgi:hypothetical protein